MIMDISILRQRLERYTRLTEAERAALDRIETRHRRVVAGNTLMAQGGISDALYIVRFGWLHASVRLPDGGRQILRYHFPGDLVGLSSIAWATAVHSFVAVVDTHVAELPKSELGRLFAEHPRVAALLYAMAAAENVAMSDRLTAIGRMDGATRLAALLLDTAARLRASEPVGDAFDLPLTQTEIGDSVGLTKVHVSRVFGRMEADGLIERAGRRIRLTDEPRMRAMTGFVDRYHEIDTSWLPGAPA